MFTSSTQKKFWTFTEEQLRERRTLANMKAREARLEFAQPEEHDLFLSVDEEVLLIRIVERSALKFSDMFQPPMWNSVRWTAYMYYKRLFLDWSTMDNMPKVAMMACFYLAMKTDEFFVTIEEFVNNLTSGTPEQNQTKILSMEPEIMRSLNYQLTVHCPYRPFEGFIMEIKTKMLLNFDVESIRPAAEDFFQKCLFGDVMLMYPPSQIALAAVKFGLDFIQKPHEVLSEFVYKLSGVEEDSHSNQAELVAHAEKCLLRLNEIVANVKKTSCLIDQEAQKRLLDRANNLAALQTTLDQRRFMARGQERRKEDPIDSDDE